MMPERPALTDDEVERALVEASRAVSADPAFAGVYTGPPWPILPTGAAGSGWKLAVLRRRPAGGADHWGHVFLVRRGAPASVSIEPERLGLSGTREAGVEPVPGRPDLPDLVAFARPTQPATAAELRRYAGRLLDRLADRLVRPPSGA